MRHNTTDRVLAEELEHIPRGPKRSPQSLLRYGYRALRAAGADRRDALWRAVDILRRHPDAVPRYDREYFGA